MIKIFNSHSHISSLFQKCQQQKTLRFVEEVKNPVLAVLEEGINNDDSPLSMLKRIWQNEAGNLEGRILEELGHYWKGLAQQGRTLEEAARLT